MLIQFISKKGKKSFNKFDDTFLKYQQNDLLSKLEPSEFECCQLIFLRILPNIITQNFIESGEAAILLQKF